MNINVEDIHIHPVHRVGKPCSEDASKSLPRPIIGIESLKSMESNKSPGSDGLPAEFYKVFWNEINQHLLTLYARIST